MTLGDDNIAVGHSALNGLSIGSDNIAIGSGTLVNNTGGNGNVAIGVSVLGNLIDNNASNSVVVGNGGLSNMLTGSNNIGIGTNVGTSLINGSDNIYIGSDAGSASETSVIRIGTLGTQTECFVQGISGVTPTGATQFVIVNGSGQLGSTGSGSFSVSSLVVSGTGAVSGCSGALSNPALSVAGGVFIGGDLGVSGNINACGTINNNADFQQNGTTILVEDALGNGNLFVGFGAGGGTGSIDISNKNTVIGFLALSNLQNGNNHNNIALGAGAGITFNSGDDNIYIGSDAGGGTESGTIRIGDASTPIFKCFIQGINGQTTGLSAVGVVVDGNGQLGTISSSLRYKKDIQTMPDQTEKMIQLRPVEFVYKHDASNTKQYGLIAEEVAQVYPDLIAYDRDGQIYTVQYTGLIPILLQQIQMLQQHAQNQDADIHELREIARTQDEQMKLLNTVIALLQQEIKK
jgi:hypothetical protein